MHLQRLPNFLATTPLPDISPENEEENIVNDATSHNGNSENTFYTARSGRKQASTSTRPSCTRSGSIFIKKAEPKEQVQNEIQAFELFPFQRYATEDYEVYK